MAFFLETLFGGLMVGMLYSLVALGFVLIFKASGVFNFAQGAMVLFAALAMARFAEWIPMWTGIDNRWFANGAAFVVAGLVMPVQAGIHSAKRAMASAANSTIAPCAKLKTPDALKISTKPSATSEYSMPAMRPPSRVSRKKPMSCFQCEVPR